LSDDPDGFRYELFTFEDRGIQRANLKTRADYQLEISSASTLLPSHAIDRIALWFEPAARFDLAFQIRDRLAHRFYPVVGTAHGLSYHGLLSTFMRVLLADTYPPDRFVCATHAARQALSNILSDLSSTLAARYAIRQRFLGGLEVIPHCVDTDVYSPGSVDESRRALGIPRSAVLLLYIGYLSPAKTDLFPILLDLARSGEALHANNVVLALAGTGEAGVINSIAEFARHVEFPHDRLRLFINIEEDAKLVLLRATDVFLSPSTSAEETFGLAPVEAMAVGVPQVVADWNGYRETVVDQVTGFLIPSLWTRCDDHLRDSGLLMGWRYDHVSLGQTIAIDLRKWHEALWTLIGNTERRREMSRASRRHAVQTFGIQAIRSRYHALWKEILSAPQPDLPPMELRPHVERPHYYDWFGHYASTHLNPQTRLCLAPYAREWQSVAQAIPQALASIGCGSGAFVSDFIELLATEGPLTIEELLARGGVEASSQEHLRRILWALKYDFVRLEEIDAG
jgi:glycosyltransferase involved in cell wall biosynthesis